MMRSLFLLFILVAPCCCHSALKVGVATKEITPVAGTPSAGYACRAGRPMQGAHDPLLATALFIESDGKQVAICSVDNLGVMHPQVESIMSRVRAEPSLERCEVHIASSHTHSGSGAHIDIPLVGEFLAGSFNPAVADALVSTIATTIIEAFQRCQPAKIGVGYGKAPSISSYRALWPPEGTNADDIAVIKVIDFQERPIALLFNYALHPTVLTGDNNLFSADFVGNARTHLRDLIGDELTPLYVNGAQAELVPVIFNEADRFDACDQLGYKLARAVAEIWYETEVFENLSIETKKEPYILVPRPTPFGLCLPLDAYKTEVNALIFDGLHAFVTIPGELTTHYDKRLKEYGHNLGYKQVSVFGLTNDAHGYILLPEAWRRKTAESALSFGGEDYGDQFIRRVERLLSN